MVQQVRQIVVSVHWKLNLLEVQRLVAVLWIVCLGSMQLKLWVVQPVPLMVANCVRLVNTQLEQIGHHV